MSEVYVVGHRNPDTDSVCSAIAYANLKNKIKLQEQKTIIHTGPDSLMRRPSLS